MTWIRNYAVLIKVNSFKQFSQKPNGWELRQNTLILQKEHFVLAGITILKGVETTPFSGTAISISRTNQTTKESKKYYLGCPFIWRSNSTEIKVVCIVKIIFWGKNSHSLHANDTYHKEKKKRLKNLGCFLFGCFFLHRDNSFVMWLLEMFTVSLVTTRSSSP